MAGLPAALVVKNLAALGRKSDLVGRGQGLIRLLWRWAGAPEDAACGGGLFVTSPQQRKH
jgi:hypothetical protein